MDALDQVLERLLKVRDRLEARAAAVPLAVAVVGLFATAQLPAGRAGAAPWFVLAAAFSGLLAILLSIFALHSSHLPIGPIPFPMPDPAETVGDYRVRMVTAYADVVGLCAGDVGRKSRLVNAAIAAGALAILCLVGVAAAGGS